MGLDYEALRVPEKLITAFCAMHWLPRLGLPLRSVVSAAELRVAGSEVDLADVGKQRL
jgi:hypothetical protein